MTDNVDINYNLMEPEIFSIPKKPVIKDFDNFRKSNNMLTQAQAQTKTIKPSLDHGIQSSGSSIFSSGNSQLGSKTAKGLKE